MRETRENFLTRTKHAHILAEIDNPRPKMQVVLNERRTGAGRDYKHIPKWKHGQESQQYEYRTVYQIEERKSLRHNKLHSAAAAGGTNRNENERAATRPLW
ncbi:hypothetical protein AGMMS49992_22310 [Clostridia bacterium]|nr:hypothetical protein AGMMS49992_22310 [Clostridia bacterium]